MLTRYGDFESALTVFEELRRRMDRLWDDFDSAQSSAGWSGTLTGASTWPLLDLYDAGANLVVTADVPGMNEKNLQINIGNGTLSISGERKADAPKAYSVHRQERGAIRFARSVSLPTKVEAERATAVVKDGVLTITLPKAAEAQPRQIAIRSE
jgi:HSP20 family protein